MNPPPSNVCRISGSLLLLALALSAPELIMPLNAQADSRLAPCPSSPNCVSSLAPPGPQAVDPLPLQGRSPQQVLQCLKQVVGTMKRARIVQEDEGYLHVTFRTLLGFVDDVEFEVDQAHGVIHMRSASRLGYWDLGVNRRRLEHIRAAVEATCP